ncbi:hypothetical protein ACIFOE_20110 [Paenibacillus sp. NRS-1783]|uniref:hypothetical protein n=1 Tax=Paenibacillus sp. NRS-1783 TaxID=3233907 RepID=UPI003D27035F
MGKHIVFSVNMTGEDVEAVVKPALHYTPAILSLRGPFGAVEILADDEQLALIGESISQHLRAKEQSA